MTNISANEQSSHFRPWYREPLVWLVIALPATAVIAGISTVFIASSGNDSLVVDGFQKVGLIAKRESSADRQARAMNVVATISIDRETGQLSARLESDDDRVDGIEELALSLHHPTRREFDQATLLLRDSTGLFRGNIGNAITGRWYIQIEARDLPGDTRNTAWRLSGRVAAGQTLITLGNGT